MKWQDKIQPLKIEKEEERDYTIHGKRIEAKTFPYENLKFQQTTAVRAYRTTSAQTIGNASWTKVQLNAESYDSLGEFDSTTNYRFTATGAGYYHITGSINWELNATGQRATSIYKNGTLVSSGDFRNAAAAVVADITIVADILYLVANDYIELYGYQNSGGDLDILTGESTTNMAIRKP